MDIVHFRASSLLCGYESEALLCPLVNAFSVVITSFSLCRYNRKLPLSGLNFEAKICDRP